MTAHESSPDEATGGYRVGLDLVAVADVDQALHDHGDRYLDRVYSSTEVADSCVGSRPVSSRLAARFAAKEALLKVLRARDVGIDWPSLEIVRAEWGGVEVVLSGTAAKRASEEGLDSFSASLTHDGGFAAAVVLAKESEVAR